MLHYKIRVSGKNFPHTKSPGQKSKLQPLKTKKACMLLTIMTHEIADTGKTVWRSCCPKSPRSSLSLDCLNSLKTWRGDVGSFLTPKTFSVQEKQRGNAMSRSYVTLCAQVSQVISLTSGSSLREKGRWRGRNKNFAS